MIYTAVSPAIYSVTRIPNNNLIWSGLICFGMPPPC